MRRIPDLAAVPAVRLAGLRQKAEAAAAGYSLLSWDGPVPEEHVAGVAAVNAAVSADIPREETREPDRFDAERTRQSDRGHEVMGMRSHTVAARSAANGELAALSELRVDPAYPSWGHQALTAVTIPHRGRRLGLLVKLGCWICCTSVNRSSPRSSRATPEKNHHMIAISAELGFRVLDRWPSWEIEVQRVLTADWA